jgi:hypothetical protein
LAKSGTPIAANDFNPALAAAARPIGITRGQH